MSLVRAQSITSRSDTLIDYAYKASIETIFIYTTALSKVISVNGTAVKLQSLKVWDTAGQERFHSLTRAYYRDTDAVLLLFDLTNYDSFIRCRSWLADVKENSLECAFICLVGSKLDLQGKRVVKFEEAIKMAQDFNLSYIETSSKTGENVNALFYITAKYLQSPATAAQKKSRSSR
ncbi:Ras-related protein Rab-26 [Trichinella pseudospiralis]|uniref:Ras-related protein Rab-26 n=1 Tax=Trichinella pseudospiralis TaxID=6337 RepID=A0A0V1IA48_TRIPS|nr:Ras-related protein Rab-26 [Trichinella pseudospiralis]KRZ26342.1 Ras-related protein Rab-26 [Trichinella pseudospiralis]